MDLKGSKTEQNLLAAFAGESQARNKYTYFASVAKKEGYQQIAEFFDINADNEKEHAKIWLKLLDGIGTTEENLASGIEGENYEHTKMYPDFAKVAKEEGFDKIAKLFEMVGAIEAHHEERFAKLLDNLKTGKVFKKDSEAVWLCRNCGHLHTGNAALEVCPVCAHPKSFFEVKAENY